MKIENIEEIFKYHKPKNDQAERYVIIREKAKELARVIIKETPESAEQTLAIRKIQEAVMFANASIAINE